MYLILVIFFIFILLTLAIHKQPDEFVVERSITIHAPAGEAYRYINSLRSWEAWSPWQKMDPLCVNSYEGPESGDGASMRWQGNSKVGAGSMTIIESKPYERIEMRLDFLKPFKATNKVMFNFMERDGGTQLSWHMKGTNKFMSKTVGLVMNCEKIVGNQFEEGLRAIKALVEDTEDS